MKTLVESYSTQDVSIFSHESLNPCSFHFSAYYTSIQYIVYTVNWSSMDPAVGILYGQLIFCNSSILLKHACVLWCDDLAKAKKVKKFKTLFHAGGHEGRAWALNFMIPHPDKLWAPEIWHTSYEVNQVTASRNKSEVMVKGKTPPENGIDDGLWQGCTTWPLYVLHSATKLNITLHQ